MQINYPPPPPPNIFLLYTFWQLFLIEVWQVKFLFSLFLKLMCWCPVSKYMKCLQLKVSHSFLEHLVLFFEYFINSADDFIACFAFFLVVPEQSLMVKKKVLEKYQGCYLLCKVSSRTFSIRLLPSCITVMTVFV